MFTTLTGLVPMSTFDVFKNFDRDFEDLMNSARVDFKEVFPPMNVFYAADDKACTIELALAGYSKDEISVEVGDNKITVAAEVKEEEKKEGKYYKQRIKKQSFTRTYAVPANVYDLEATEVSYVDGLLTINVPAKAPEEPKTKKLEIKG